MCGGLLASSGCCGARPLGRVGRVGIGGCGGGRLVVRLVLTDVLGKGLVGAVVARHLACAGTRAAGAVVGCARQSDDRAMSGRGSGGGRGHVVQALHGRLLRSTHYSLSLGQHLHFTSLDVVVVRYCMFDFLSLSSLFLIEMTLTTKTATTKEISIGFRLW